MNKKNIIAFAWYSGMLKRKIMRAYARYEKEVLASNPKEPVSDSACPICGSPVKYNNYESGLPIKSCSNIDCDWTD